MLVFKYTGFAVGSADALLRHLGLRAGLVPPALALPMGLSFFTFRVLGYIIDCYRGALPPQRSLLQFATFVAFFPTLLAGPIERAPLISSGSSRTAPSVPTAANLADGLSLFVLGLFNKIALADALTLYVDKVYAAPASLRRPHPRGGHLRLRLEDLL